MGEVSNNIQNNEGLGICNHYLPLEYSGYCKMPCPTISYLDIMSPLLLAHENLNPSKNQS